ncbi:hypothetical protein [Spiroplasma chrysopicola]|uniref:Lipoprotein n=1 Tax=Spiroplasma chrysopicola DF-1 TaxID=1276227 RepID=R4U4A2_9MOLU|nr:hypothetical protein [Spiroplasma chrysopicola]AGM25393.1 hypothetical protein SCHRY_v1c08170 [Spiroplasma chrysopicola DF-1]
MRKLLLVLPMVTLLNTTATTLIACSWGTPPLNVETIYQIMNRLQEQAGYQTSSVGEITNPGTIAALPMPKPVVSDLQDPTQQDSIAHARTASDAITNLASNYITTNVKEQKNITGEEDSFYQNKNIDASLFQNYYFTTRIANLKAAQVGPETQEKWIFDYQDDSNTMEDFKWTNGDNNIVRFKNDNQNADSGQGENYSYLNIQKLWSNGKMFNLDDKNNIITIVKPYEKESSQIYTVRFLVSFSPIAKFGYDPIKFYLDFDFSS